MVCHFIAVVPVIAVGAHIHAGGEPRTGIGLCILRMRPADAVVGVLPVIGKPLIAGNVIGVTETE